MWNLSKYWELLDPQSSVSYSQTQVTTFSVKVFRLNLIDVCRPAYFHLCCLLTPEIINRWYLHSLLTPTERRWPSACCPPGERLAGCGAVRYVGKGVRLARRRVVFIILPPPAPFIDLHARMHEHTQAHIGRRTRTCTRISTHTHARARAHTRTHAHTHTLTH